MQIPANAQTVEMVVTHDKEAENGSVTYTMYAPYTPEMFANVPEGLGSHAVLARKANQTFHEDVNNNVRSRNRARVAKGEAPLTQEEFDEYLAQYEPGVRASSGPSVDPVVAKARILIKKDLRKDLKAKKGLGVAKKGTDAEKGKTITFEAFEQLVEKVLEGKHRETYLAKARKALEEDRTVSESLLD